jgi:hypothetical protein
MALVRGSNPIWFEVDLTARAFDDTFYLFILQNQIPYIPATVWQDPFGNVEWSNPIRFFANGTLPNNIYYDPDTVYRLEFRRGPTQQDPLIYLVENYVPGASGETPIVDTSFSTDNQITNPQFALINFTSPLTLNSISSATINVAPDWFLHLTGTGNVILTQVLLNSTVKDPTNASYALRIQLSGTWTKAYLSQRFHQNGILWSNTFVSSSIMALSGNPPQNISAKLVDSQGNDLTTVLPVTPLTEAFNEYRGVGEIFDSINTDFPPTAYIEYQLALPVTCDITLSSIQLISGDVGIAFPYSQTTIERQIDQTFHYYKDSLLRQSKESLLTGWDFGLNPWQFRTTAQTNLATFGYTADQTIMVQQLYVVGSVGNTISVGQASDANNHGFTVQAVSLTNQFAMIQYIAPQTIRSSWGTILSSFVRLNARKQNNLAPLRAKMRLIYRDTLPPALSQLEPIISWPALGEPVFAVGWNAIAPLNDPIFNILGGFNEFYFEGFQLPAASTSLMTLGIVIYTLDNMNQTGTPDNIIFDQISLAQSDFSIETTRLSFDETLRRCQYYYSKSFENGTVPATGITPGETIFPQTVAALGNGISQSITLPVRMRVAPTITLLNPVSANSLVRNISISADCTASSAADVSASLFAVTYTAVAGSNIGDGLAIQWTANARLGG